MSSDLRRDHQLIDDDGTGADLLAPADVVESTTGAPVAEGTSRAIRIHSARLRDEVQLLAVDASDFHHKAQRYDLQSRTQSKARKSIGSLLEELAVERGLSWSDIASLVGVSVAAIRKWRRGGPVTGDNRRAVARLAAFLDLLEELPVEDPGGWMEVPLVEGYSLTAMDVYRHDGGDVALLDYASQRVSVEQVLDQLRPGWRESDRSSFEVVPAADGELALRRRQ
jgi:transcriptional regulator with XRE-family HTH domain